MINTNLIEDNKKISEEITDNKIEPTFEFIRLLRLIEENTRK